MRTTRVLGGAILSVGFAVAGLTVGSGDAVALPSQPHQWCPGMSMHNPPGPGAMNHWDMNVCHTWQYVKPGMGNVPTEHVVGVDPVTYRPTGYEVTLEDSFVWDGPNVPPGAARECGNDGFLGISVSC